MHGAICEHFRFIMHVRGSESLTYKVGYPITEIIVMCRDEAALLAVKGVANRECCPTASAMGRQIRWINGVAQEELIPPFLCP